MVWNISGVSWGQLSYRSLGDTRSLPLVKEDACGLNLLGCLCPEEWIFLKSVPRADEAFQSLSAKNTDVIKVPFSPVEIC